jgi:hypothetical protein
MGSASLFAVTSRSAIFASTHHQVAIAFWYCGAKFVGLSYISAGANSAALTFVQNELALLKGNGSLQLQMRNHAQALVGFSEKYSNGSNASLRSAWWHARQADGVSAYTQWMGEDVAGKALPLPNKFMSIWGVEGTFSNGRFRVFAEYANTISTACPGTPILSCQAM